MAAWLLVRYWMDLRLAGEYAVQEFDWFGSGVNIRLAFGLDGLSVWMFGLSALLTFVAVLASWRAIEDRPGVLRAHAHAR